MSDLICPRCRAAVLEKCEQNGREVDVCCDCGGMWLRSTVLPTADNTTVSKPTVDLLKDVATTEGAASELSCPNCAQSPKLTELHIDDVNDLTVDACSQCSGFWFDHSEWDHLEACRSWKQAQQSAQKTPLYLTWVFQILTGLPAEFNIRPRRRPVVTISLMVICTAVFLLADGVLSAALAASADWGPLHLLGSLFSHQFVHADWLHLAGNMYFLYVLGDNVEDVMGRRRFAVFYLICGIAAAAPHLLLGTDITMVGASGAIAGVMGSYFALFPDAAMTVMFKLFHFRISARFWMAGWIAFQAICLWYDPTGAASGTAWSAHVSGFVVGVLLTLLWRQKLVDGHPFLHLVATRRLRLVETPEAAA